MEKAKMEESNFFPFGSKGEQKEGEEPVANHCSMPVSTILFSV